MSQMLMFNAAALLADVWPTKHCDGRVFNWGVIGSGSIVRKMSYFMNRHPCVNPYGIASATGRNLTSSMDFAKIMTIEELLSDPNIHIVYIASANVFHAKHTIMALNYKKHVLCEKPLTTDFPDAKSVMAEAVRQNQVLIEGVFSAYLPGMALLTQISLGGPIRFIELNKKIGTQTASQSPIFYDKKLAGGVFDGCGSYTMQALLALVGHQEFASIADDQLYVTTEYNEEHGIDVRTTVTVQTNSWAAVMRHEVTDVKKPSRIVYDDAEISFYMTKLDVFNVTMSNGIEFQVSLNTPTEFNSSIHPGLYVEIDKMHEAIKSRAIGAGVKEYDVSSMSAVALMMHRVRSRMNAMRCYEEL